MKAEPMVHVFVMVTIDADWLAARIDRGPRALAHNQLTLEVENRVADSVRFLDGVAAVRTAVALADVE